MSIHIEQHPYMESHWYKGVWENVREDNEGYDFDLIVTTNDESSEECEVIWTLGSPGGDDIETEIINESIIEQFKSIHI